MEDNFPENVLQKEFPGEGSSRIWDALWKKSLDRSRLPPCLFTRGKTRTLIEFWQRTYARDLLTLIKDKNYKDFIELGSGRGTTSMYLADAAYDQITLVDLSAEARELATLNFNRFQLTYKDFILADVRHTPLPGDSFDCIYNIGLLEHFTNPTEIFSEAYRLLRKEGLLFMVVFPDIKSKSSYLLRLLFNPFSYIKHLVKAESSGHDQMIRNKLSLEEYIGLGNDAGFVNFKGLYYNPYPKIIRDSWYENNVILPMYKSFSVLKFKNQQEFIYRTSKFFGNAYLLIAYK